MFLISLNFDYGHWRRSALNSAGALQGGGGEFRGIFIPFYTINFRGLCKSGVARAPAAPAAPPSSAQCLLHNSILPKKGVTNLLHIKYYEGESKMGQNAIM